MNETVDDTQYKSGKRLTKQQVLDIMKRDVRAADTLRQETVANVDRWRKEYDGEPYGNEVDGKSKLVSKDIKRQDEWQHASVKDPFVSDLDIIKCSPITASDRKAAEQNQLVLNTQFTRQFNRFEFMTDVIKLYYREGTVIVKTGWDYEDEIEEVEMPVMALDPLTQQPYVSHHVKIPKRNVLLNKPTAEVCRVEDVYRDPTCMGSTKKAKFFCHRYETDLSTLHASSRYKNLDRLANSSGNSKTEGDFDEEDDTNFMFTDAARKKLLAYEYWGFIDIDGDGKAEPIVGTWVNDILIELRENPLPDKEIPFLVVQNNRNPFEMDGEASVELISDQQKITTAIKRGIMDNMANSNNAQKGVPKGVLDTQNLKRYLNGKNFEFNGDRSQFWEGSYNQIPSSVFSVLEMTNNETESMLGVKAFTGGINGSGLGSTAKAAGGVLDAVSVRRSDIVRNIAETLIKPMMRKWMAYNSEFLQPEEVIRITEDQFVEIQRDDLKGLIDINIEVSTAESNSLKSERLSFLLQTLGQNMDPAMRNIFMAQIATLERMPDMAKALKEYQPQPDPIAQEMALWELRKLKAEVIERESRARENDVDIRAKNAQAALNEAKTAEINSNRDLKDLEYVRKAEGTEFNEKMAEKDHDRGTQQSLAIENNRSKERMASRKH